MTTRFADFDAMVRQATGGRHGPYPYQQRVANEGLPDLLKVPTGCGKTLAMVLAWLYRRQHHPAATPRWLAYALPMRVLVEQVEACVKDWVANLGLTGSVRVYRVMGGEGRLDCAWRSEPEADAVFVGTLDMLLSRALNRGYAQKRKAWPIDFGLFNAGVHWVFDEVQLMGPALPTSRQLEGLRRSLGTAMPCASTWMSATVDHAQLVTIDNPAVSATVELSPADASGALARRLEAPKTVARLAVAADAKRYAPSLAQSLAERHQPGTRTIAVINTVERARDLYDRLARLRPGAELVLVHSRFRPGDRQRAIDRALGPPGGHGTIVVTTQVLEAGVDVSSSMLYTETAPWPSVVQRAGRCNRDGLEPAPTLLWAPAPKAPPYEQADLDATAAALTDLEGRVITPATLGQLDVATVPAVHPILRRRDLIGLFDTAPDLSGNDIDIGRFIREADDLDAHVAWRALGKAGPEADEPGPTASELCPVPLQELREYLASRSGWFVDHLSAKAWARLGRADVRPGLVAILDATQGGYDPDRGWDPRSTARVPPLLERDEPSPLAGGEEPTGADPLSATVRRPSLLDHLREAEQAATNLASQLDPPGLSAEACSAAIAAASLHDVGKAHPVFQESLRKAAGLDPEKGDGQLWAKSGTRGRLIHSRRHFRHELASALALLGDGSVVLDGLAEPDLATYLVAAHHGVVRLGIRSLPGDDSARCPNAGGRVALGVCDGDRLPDVVTPRGTVPGLTLDLAAMELGDSPDGRPSWAARVLALRDRPDLGPFRLGFLEALVVLADWRVSSDDFVPATPGGPA